MTVSRKAVDGRAMPGARTPRGPLTTAHRQKLQQIKDVSAEIFWERGYAATDLRQIAFALDMHVSTLYNYIHGKEHLLYMIMIDGMDEITARMDRALASQTDPAQQLRAALEAHILHHAHRRSRAWIGHVELRALTGEYRSTIQNLRDEYEQRWVELLRRGMREGAFTKASPKLVAYGLLAIGQSVSRWYDPNGKQSAESIARTLAATAMNGVLTRPAPADKKS
jgi:TetR/AcrR family transcriptional regulator, cholesterol catabolism regulator